MAQSTHSPNKGPSADAIRLHSPPSSSPIELPELLQEIIACLPLEALSRACQVSRLFHNIGAPLLWKSLYLQGEMADRVWQKEKGFRMGLIRYGRFVESLRLIETTVQDGDMELIAENCPRLKMLDLTRTNVTAETLRVLIHSDPYNTRQGSVKKRKKKQPSGSAGGVGQDADDQSDEDEDGDINAKMFKYRSMTETETETEHDAGHHQYESVGLPSTATESEQEPPQGEQQQQQPTGPVLRTTRSTTRALRPIAPANIPLHRRAGAARPAKFKGSKTQFPYHLETLILNRCSNLTGQSCLAVVSQLGPQLKSLSLNHVSELEDSDLIKASQHCPNLVNFSLKGTEIKDEFLKALCSIAERKLESLNVDMTDITEAGLIPVISSSRASMTALCCQHSTCSDEVLFALVEDPDAAQARKRIKKSRRTIPDPIQMTLHLNNVLTDIRLAYCSRLTDQGLQILFRQATELTHVELDGCNVADGALMVLAETNRNRMERLGYGVPAAWHEQELADERLKVARLGSEASTLDGTSTSTRATGFSVGVAKKLFTVGIIKGGLQALSLKNCDCVTNKGLRAIVRSCVALQSLNLCDCGKVTMQVFHGPWACLQLMDLNISGICLSSDELSCQEQKEDRMELRRFPSPSLQYNEEDDFDKDGNYDYIAMSDELMGEDGPRGNLDIMELLQQMDEDMEDLDDYWDSEDDEDEGEEDEDEGEDEDEEQDENEEGEDDESEAEAEAEEGEDHVEDDEEEDNEQDDGEDSDAEAENDAEDQEESHRKDAKTSKPRFKFPKTGRNTDEQRVTLREFYSKLGQFRQLVQLDISHGNYRIRVRDGLDLALPALQQNLVILHMARPLGYVLGERELIWFGKNFGYGYDYTQEEDELETQKKTIAEHKCKGRDEGRVARLEEITVGDCATDDMDGDVYDWFVHQGLFLDVEEVFDPMWR